MREGKGWQIRLLIGAVLGAVLAPLIVYFFWGSFAVGVGEGRPLAAFGVHALAVLPRMADTFGSAEAAAVVQSLLGGLFGTVVALATLPFADDGRELVARSLGHFVLTLGSFALLLSVCCWGGTLVWSGVLALLYGLIWLGRWIGWYVEVVQLRALLGLDPGPTPLKWRETTPYLPFVALVCCALPVALRLLEKLLGADIPVFTGLLYPYLVLPVVGFLSGVSLGKRQGVCPLYPVACFVLYLPMVPLLFNGSALFHCFMIALPALVGNVLGWLYRRAVPKKRGAQ